jgi:hypothetical protein
MIRDIAIPPVSPGVIKIQSLRDLELKAI